jgi:uncharacterized protein YdhG (YjbR/CyaY superfamily)
MQSNAPTVAAYLQGVPDERKGALHRLRTLCRRVLSEHEEGMDYGMPSYRRRGRVDVAFASQKRSVNLYVMVRDVLDKHRARLKGLSVGKGCIRYPRPERMDFAAIEDLLTDVLKSNAEPC